MNLLARRDPAHFDGVVRAYTSELFHYALWITGDRHGAEDALQEALVRAWKSWTHVQDEGARRAWLYTIVRNECHRASRSRLRPEVPYDDEQVAAIADERDFTAALDVRQALERLPHAALEPLVMQAVGGLSGEEIAAALGVSVAAAMTRLSRARSALRDLVNDSAPAAAGTSRKRRTA
jgi:RNA polymerase sigma-70 factor (ECF subfamily)